MSYTSIVNNSTATAAANQLTTNEYNLNKTIGQLSTGLRINTPADDVAGNALANRLGSNINVVTQGSLNAQDGISVVQVAQGGLGQVASALQQLNTLAASAASASKSNSDRQDIQNEVNQLLQQINQIVSQTQFGTQNLLDGTIQGAQVGVAGTVVTSNNAYIGTAGNSIVNAVGVATASLLAPVTNSTSFLDEAFRITITPSTVSSSSFIVNVFASGTLPASGAQPDTLAIATIILSPAAVANNATLIPVTITSSGVGGATFVATLNFQGITISDIANIIGTNAFVTTQAFQPAITQNNSLLIQVGANVGQVDQINASSVLTKNLFSGQNVLVGSILQAEGALQQISHAINIVSTDQAQLGATQNRFQDISANNTVLSQNETAAKSRITDLDVANASVTLTSQQILVQSATSMLAQANLLPQNLLSLLPHP